ncbi:hypothetical protein BDZ94DRAFT_1300946 [Collybia nuda]|uniref:G domain-containing protein n=1 Tax=Collybia nuda TaxID=64659 RepID=A0A9P6CFB2_9AGAR|nr:hypothetical protein BDZ94DRAFT_1300946 [Collybia nuda]
MTDMDASRSGQLARLFKIKLTGLGWGIIAVFEELEQMRIALGSSLRMIFTFCKEDIPSPTQAPPQLIPEETSDSEVLIVVLGHCGSGKSTLINYLTGSELKVFDSLDNWARPVQLGKKFEWGSHIVTLIDTPGFDVAKGDLIIRGIHNSLGSTQEKKLRGMIYLQPIYSRGPEMIPEPVPRLVKNLCDAKNLKKLVVIKAWHTDITPGNEGGLDGATIIDYPEINPLSDVKIVQSAILGAILGV